MLIRDTDLSSRAKNILLKYHLEFDSKVRDLENVSLTKLKKTYYTGEKVISEIQKLCKKANISLKP